MATITRTPETKSKSQRPAATRRFVSEDGLLAVKDWLALSETKPRYELIDGQLLAKKPASFANVNAAGSFLINSMKWSPETGWQFFPQGTGVLVNENTGYIPDLVGFEANIFLDLESRISPVPSVAVDVLKSSTKGLGLRKSNYAKVGVELYILIDPDTKIFEAYRLAGDQYGTPETLQENDVWQPAELPGLRLELSQLWM